MKKSQQIIDMCQAIQNMLDKELKDPRVNEPALRRYAKAIKWFSENLSEYGDVDIDEPNKKLDFHTVMFVPHSDEFAFDGDYAKDFFTMCREFDCANLTVFDEKPCIQLGIHIYSE